MADEPEGDLPPFPPLPPKIASLPPAPPSAALMAAGATDYDRKLADLEKRLQEEREKVLLANLKNQSEAVTAARVEVSIKELQDRLRRDRREQEGEEARLKLESKLQEMEGRIAQERETWVQTLRGQLSTRENQDKEIETHFTLRLQEMERRWLEEKASWQKAAMAKEEELRTARAQLEKLKGADIGLEKLSAEKKWLETRVSELSEERAQSQARVAAAGEREKEAAELRAELTVSRAAAAGLQEKLERELQAARATSREREERLLADQERLQRELATVADRLRADHEGETRRLRADGDAQTRRFQEALERAGADMQKLRGVLGALERQTAAYRVQISELQASRADWEKVQERYKAEFVVLQRKWAEREKEIRAESQTQSLQLLEAEKSKIRVLAQDEINQRAAKVAEQLEREKDGELKRSESLLRAELEREISGKLRKLQDEWDEARRKFEAEARLLRDAAFQKEGELSQRLLTKESELHASALKLEDASGRVSRLEAAATEREREKLEAAKAAQTLREEVGALKSQLDEASARGAAAERERQSLKEKEVELERLSAAQAAQVAHGQEALEQMRGQVARELHLSKLYLGQKDDLEKDLKGQLDSLRRELEAARSASPVPALAPAPGPDPDAEAARAKVGELEAALAEERRKGSELAERLKSAVVDPGGEAARAKAEELEKDLAEERRKSAELAEKLKAAADHSLAEHFFRKAPPGA